MKEEKIANAIKLAIETLPKDKNTPSLTVVVFEEGAILINTLDTTGGGVVVGGKEVSEGWQSIVDRELKRHPTR